VIAPGDSTIEPDRKAPYLGRQNSLATSASGRLRTSANDPRLFTCSCSLQSGRNHSGALTRSLIYRELQRSISTTLIGGPSVRLRVDQYIAVAPSGMF